MEPFHVNGKMDGKKLASAIAVPVLGGAAVGWLANRDAQKKFQRLEKPGFAPPPAAFPIAWNILYATMGFARYRAGMRKRDKGMEDSFVRRPAGPQLPLVFPVLQVAAARHSIGRDDDFAWRHRPDCGTLLQGRQGRRNADGPLHGVGVVCARAECRHLEKKRLEVSKIRHAACMERAG